MELIWFDALIEMNISINRAITSMNVYGSQTPFNEMVNHMIIVGSYFDFFLYLMSGGAAGLSLV